MKLAVVFPSAVYKEGHHAIAKFIQEVERIGFDQLDFRESPAALRQARQKPPPDVLATLGFAAGITTTLGLGTKSLLLSTRETLLAAEQIAALRFMSRNRVRLGISLSHYKKGPSKTDDNGGERLDQAVALLRGYWRGETRGFDEAYYRSDDLLGAPTSQDMPIWFTGSEPEVLARTGRYAHGWSGERATGRAQAEMMIEMIRRYAGAAGRDPKTIELESSLAPFSRESRHDFFDSPQRIVTRLLELRSMGFNWASIDLEPAYQGKQVDWFVERLWYLYETLQTGLAV